MPIEGPGKDVDISSSQPVNAASSQADLPVTQTRNVSAVTALCVRTLYGTIKINLILSGRSTSSLNKTFHSHQYFVW